MTRNELEMNWKYVEAFKNGECVQYSYDDGRTWLTCKRPSFTSDYKYRVKPSIVPFENCMELLDCWNKMTATCRTSDCLTLPTIWVKEKELGNMAMITEFCTDGMISINGEYITLKELFEEFTFLNGAVIGKEE